jgi:hypothetical protein
MSTPRDPYGEPDRGHRAVGGQGEATGPEQSAETHRAETDRAEPYRSDTGRDDTARDDTGGSSGDSASATVPRNGRSGWDFTPTVEADPPTPAFGSPAVGPGYAAAEDESTPVHGWLPEGDDWSSGTQEPEGTAGGSWDPEDGRTAAHPTPGGWDPEGAGIADTASATSIPGGGEGRAARRRGQSGGRRKKLVAGAAVLVVVLAALGVTAFWRPGFLVREEFDRQALQAGVTQVLTHDYGLGATGVSCPEGQKVERGATFTCSATVDGENVEVPVTVLDDQGTYQVGRV